MNTQTPPRLLTVAAAAEALGVHRSTIYRGIEGGRIPAVQLGGPGAPLRIPENELMRWVFGPASETEARE